MKPILKFLSRARGAGGIEYALIVGLIAVVGIGAVAATGDTVKDIYCSAGERIAELQGETAQPCLSDAGETPGENPGDGSEGPGGEPGEPPVLFVELSPVTIGFGGSSSISWTATDATGLLATTTYSGTCSDLSTLGTDPLPLAWNDIFIGTDSLDWSTGVADCSETICVYASNDDGMTEACSVLTYEPWDNEPDAFDFVDIADAAPSTLIQVSDGVVLGGFDGSIPVSIDNTENGAAYRIAGGEWLKNGGVISAGQLLEIRVISNNAFAQDPSVPESSRLVTVTAGQASADWLVENAVQDTSVEPFSFGPPLIAEIGEAVTSEATPTTFAGFTGTLDLVLTTSDVPAAQGGAKVTNDGVTSIYNFAANGVLSFPVTTETVVTLFMTAPATFGEARHIEATLGDPASQAVWEVTAAATKLVFSTPTITGWTVPAGVTSIAVKAWGGGGGGATYPGNGGAGGALTATLAVTPGQELTIYVAGGGSIGGTKAGILGGTGFRTGGNAGVAYAAGGGGASAIVSGSDVLIVAAGGGGAGWGAIANAGGGGGLNGGNGAAYQSGLGGSGATQNAHGNGGASGGQPGSASGGGTGGTYAGGGGGGWYSGGGGGSSGGGGGSGGGGSSYINPAFGSGTLYSAIGPTRGNTSDPDLLHGTASSSNNTAGGPGMVVIDW